MASSSTGRKLEGKKSKLPTARPNGKKKKTSSPIDRRSIEGLLALHSELAVREEYKEPIPPFRGTDVPTTLRGPAIPWRIAESKSTSLLKESFKMMLGESPYRITLGTALDMSSNGIGIVNSAIFVSGLASVPEFTSLSAIFDQFFVHGLRVEWRPVARYQGPVSWTPSPTVAINNRPIGVASLQHSQAAYTSLTNMTNNFKFEYHSTGDPFTYTWMNIEDASQRTVVSVTGQTLPFQSWGPTANVANVTGGIQFLSQSAPPALPTSQVLGTFAVHYDISFRVRL